MKTSTSLNIGDDLRLPVEFTTQTMAVLAKRGAGKTYAASIFAEELLKVNQQVVFVDPTGATWGLKSSADGKHPGFSIVVFGGEHADVPLEENAGEIIATAIIEHRFSAILDLSLFRKGQLLRFMTPFLETLYRLNREPMHLIVDEADAIAPQRPFSEETRTLGAMEDVVRRGRKRGIGCTMISQRAAVLNKNILTQAEILCALRLTHPKDIDAIHEWVNVHGDPDKARAMISSLPSLPIGTAWFWAPGWGDIFTRVKIRKRETFDSSATPKVGQEVKRPSVMAPVDIEKLGKQIQDTVQKAKANDPQALKRRIQELERELSKKPEPVDQKAIDQKIDEAARRKIIEAFSSFRSQIERGMKNWSLAASKLSIDMKAALEVIFENSAKMPSLGGLIKQSPGHFASNPKWSGREWVKERFVDGGTHMDWLPRDPPKRSDPINRKEEEISKLRAGAERMLAALVQWSPESMSEGQMRSHAGLKKSGTFATYLSDLFRGGYVDRQDGMLRATRKGIEYFGGNVPVAPRDTKDVLSIWIPKLRYGAVRILQTLVAERGDPIPLDRLAQLSELSKSGTFSTYLSDLRTARLIITEKGMARANRETLFL